MSPMKQPFMTLTLTTLITSTIMMLSSSNWMFIWCGLEVNLLSFIPIMTYTNKFQENEGATKYFLTQALGSSLILMASSALWMHSTTLNHLLILIALILKMGMAPCHFWFPSVMSSLSWLNCLILSTWQKLGPLAIMSMILKSPPIITLMTIICSLNAITGGLMGMNQSKLKSIMAYSSITHMGWMTSPLIMNNPSTTLYYFLFYCILSTPMFMIMYWMSSDTQLQLQKASSSMNMMFLIIPLIILSISGLPPLTGFFPKLMVMMSISTSHPALLLTLILGAMMNMYFYLNLTFSILMTYKSSQLPHPTKLTTPMIIMSTMLLPTPLTML